MVGRVGAHGRRRALRDARRRRLGREVSHFLPLRSLLWARAAVRARNDKSAKPLFTHVLGQRCASCVADGVRVRPEALLTASRAANNRQPRRTGVPDALRECRFYY